MLLGEEVDEWCEEKWVEILEYIEGKMYKRGKMRGKDIREDFGIWENYLGGYMKKDSNESMEE